MDADAATETNAEVIARIACEREPVQLTMDDILAGLVRTNNTRERAAPLPSRTARLPPQCRLLTVYEYMIGEIPEDVSGFPQVIPCGIMPLWP